MNDNQGNVLQQCICGREGTATVIGTRDHENKVYPNCTIYLNVNKDILDKNTRFFIEVYLMKTPKSQNILSIWIPHDCSKNIIKQGNTSIRFVNFCLMTANRDQKTSFTFDFKSDQHYWEHDYIGNKFDGYLPPIWGSKDGVEVSGYTAEGNRAAFLIHLQTVFQQRK